MFVETMRALAAHLNDGTEGINAKLALLAAEGLLETGDAKPADVAIVTDSTSNRSVAQGMPPVTPTGALYSPSVSVMLYDDCDLAPPEVATSERYATVPLVIRFFSNNSNTHDGMRYALYYARATAQSLTGFTRLQSKERNGVIIRNTTNIRFQPVQVIEEGANGLEWAFVVTFLVRDQRP